MENKNIVLINEVIKKMVSAVPKFQTNITSAFQVVQKQFDTLNKALEPVLQTFKKIQDVTASIAEFMKYHMLVPPQVYDFLVKLNVPLSLEEIKELQKVETEENRLLYTIYTRKTKGKKIYNPHFYVNKDMFKAIDLLVARNGSSLSVDSKIVYFDPNTRALNVFGIVTYIKKDSDRYRLCKYLFAKKKGPREWEVEDMVNALSDGDRVFTPANKKASYDWINGKVRELNKDIEKSIGIEELISYEEGRFVLNGVNKV